MPVLTTAIASATSIAVTLHSGATSCSSSRRPPSAGDAGEGSGDAVANGRRQGSGEQDQESGGSEALAIVALIVAVAALASALAELVLSRRRAGTGAPPTEPVMR
jgi:hypothetical protein